MTGQSLLDMPIPEERKQASDFDYIYNADGTCGARYDCCKPGVVLAYDDFSPEDATWFCEACWPIFEMVMVIVEDKRPKIEPTAQEER